MENHERKIILGFKRRKMLIRLQKKKLPNSNQNFLLFLLYAKNSYPLREIFLNVKRSLQQTT
jgi:hypothetical protein